jgi:DNA-3-methyladenine glycosylase
VSVAARALHTSFFARHPSEVASDLLGCVLVVEAGGERASGRIVETEAYLGADDPGSHAATRGITPRNAVMYGTPGTAYVYFTYGNHHMLNFVCEDAGTAGAVLVRAVEPLDGVEVMTSRRKGRPFRELCSGPGKLTQALGIDLSDNDVALGNGRITVYHGERPPSGAVATSGRVGLSAGHELELRYFVSDSPFVSRGPNTKPRGTHVHADHQGRTRT